MKITVREDENCPADEIVISCHTAGAEVQSMLAALRTGSGRISGQRDGKTFIINTADVFYFESVDKKTFIYTAGQVLETPLRLYEIEDNLFGQNFFRASKSMVLNIEKIASLRPEFAGRIEVTMENGEQMLVSRQYAPTLKEKLGL